MEEDVVVPIVAILMPLVLVPTVMVLKHLGRKREWEHRERMRAMELGLPIPGGDAWPALAAIAIGCGVPVGASFCAWMASLTGRSGGDGWGTAAFLGAVGVIGGTKLAGRLLAARERSRDVSRASDAKPAYDPDAFDVVGRRG